MRILNRVRSQNQIRKAEQRYVTVKVAVDAGSGWA